jgi:MinD superfamily P-loop ATPase
MKIAVASGKGGTGKTTVATSLAYVASRSGYDVAFLDCDVENPNGHLFLKPKITQSQPAGHLTPQVDQAKCTGCGRCADVCQYSAIVCLRGNVLVYPELCHGCGGCWRACPDHAITEVPRNVGIVETGQAGSIRFVHGRLSIGEAKSPPVIKAVKEAAPEAELVITDAPPGTSCPVVESIRGCDLVLLVTEPTPFGLNDLKLAVEMVRALQLPFGVVVNRADLGDRAVWRYCRQQGVEILAEIQDDRTIAEAYSRGEVISEALPALYPVLSSLLKRVVVEVKTTAALRH